MCKKRLSICTEEDIEHIDEGELNKARIMEVKAQLALKVDFQKRLDEKTVLGRLKYRKVRDDKNEKLYVYKVRKHAKKRKRLVRWFISEFLSVNIGRFLALVVSYLVILEVGIIVLEHSTQSVKLEGVQMAINVVSLAAGFFGMETVVVRYKYKPFTGWWCYHVSPKTVPIEAHLARVQTEQVRVVRIDIHRGSLRLTGYQITDDGCREHFYSDVAEVQYSTDDKRAGTLFYCFSDSIGSIVKGLCALDWRNANGVVDQMKGWYAGQESQVIGQINYRRITKKEFKALTGGVR